MSEEHRDIREGFISGWSGGMTAIEDPATARKFDNWHAEVVRAAKAEAWDEGVEVALNHAVRNSDGITLSLTNHHNPYRGRSDDEH